MSERAHRFELPGPSYIDGSTDPNVSVAAPDIGMVLRVFDKDPKQTRYELRYKCGQVACVTSVDGIQVDQFIAAGVRPTTDYFDPPRFGSYLGQDEAVVYDHAADVRALAEHDPALVTE